MTVTWRPRRVRKLKQDLRDLRDLYRFKLETETRSIERVNLQVAISTINKILMEESNEAQLHDSPDH